MLVVPDVGRNMVPCGAGNARATRQSACRPFAPFRPAGGTLAHPVSMHTPAALPPSPYASNLGPAAACVCLDRPSCESEPERRGLPTSPGFSAG